MSNTQEKKSWEEEFIGELEKLGPGELAALRRAAGTTLGEQPKDLWFFRFLSQPHGHETAFIVATLLAQYKTLKIKSGRHRGDGNFGVTWKRAIAGSNSDSLRRRFHILLDSDLTRHGEGDLPYRLRQMVKYASSKDIGVDWVQLLKDLNRWHYQSHPVQKSWAASFFSNDSQTTEDPPETS